MARNRQVPTQSNVDLRVTHSDAIATYQLKRDADFGLVGLCHVSSMCSDGFARALAEHQVALSEAKDKPETDLLQLLHRSTGEPLFSFIQQQGVNGSSSFVAAIDSRFSLPALSEHIRFFEKTGLGFFGGSVVETTAAKYVLALSFGVSTVQEFLAAFDGISLSAVKSRIQRARAEGLLPNSTKRRRVDVKSDDAG